MVHALQEEIDQFSRVHGQLALAPHTDAQFTTCPIVEEVYGRDPHGLGVTSRCHLGKYADTHVRFHHAAHRVEAAYLDALPHAAAKLRDLLLQEGIRRAVRIQTDEVEFERI